MCSRRAFHSWLLQASGPALGRPALRSLLPAAALLSWHAVLCKTARLAGSADMLVGWANSPFTPLPGHTALPQPQSNPMLHCKRRARIGLTLQPSSPTPAALLPQIVYLIIIGDVLVGVPPDFNGLITNLLGIHDPSGGCWGRPGGGEQRAPMSMQRTGTVKGWEDGWGEKGATLADCTGPLDGHVAGLAEIGGGYAS